MDKAASILQSKVKRQIVQPVYNKYLKTARQNYDIETLKKMSAPFRADELKAAWSDKQREMTIYNKPINKLKKHELYHELLNVNYDFSALEKKEVKPATVKVKPPPKPRGRPKKPVSIAVSI